MGKNKSTHKKEKKKTDCKKSSNIYLMKKDENKKKYKLKKWVKSTIGAAGIVGVIMIGTYFVNSYDKWNHATPEIKGDTTAKKPDVNNTENNINNNNNSNNSDNNESNSINGIHSYSENNDKSPNDNNQNSNNMNPDFVECEVGDPKKRSDEEVYRELKEMAKSDKKVEKIYVEKEKYPIALLSAMVNNPEMINFVNEYLDRDAVEVTSFNMSDLEKKNALMIQWDKRWGYKPYGSSIIAVSGCAPTCLAMVINSLSQETVTPYDVAQFSEDNGYYIKGVGTDWKLMTRAVANYGLEAEEMGFSEKYMKEELDKGHMIIATMSPGNFTAEGHFVVIYGYDEDGFLINDPNCVYRSKKSWSFKDLSSQINNMWCYSKRMW